MKQTFLHELRLIYSTNKQSQNKNRLLFLDMTRGFAILLVVLGHCGTINHSCNVWLSTFHLPVFFIISGILMWLKEDAACSFTQLFIQKARRIMVPYLYFSIGSLCLDFIQILRGRFSLQTLWNHALQTITLQGYSVLWFLPVLFLAEMLLIMLHKAFARFKCPKVFCPIIMILCMSVLAAGGYYVYHRLLPLLASELVLALIQIPIKVLFAVAFMSYGYLFGSFLIKKQLADRKSFCFAAGTVLFAINVLALPYVSLMNLNLLQLENPWAYLFLGITGSTGCILLFKSIPNIPLLAFWGQNSLIIMCTHVNFYIMYCSILLNLNLFPKLIETSDAAYILLTVAGTLVLSVPVIIVIRVLFPFVLGLKQSPRA